VRARGHFPTDEAATKLIWLVLHEIVGGGRNFAQIWRTKFAHSDRVAAAWIMEPLMYGRGQRLPAHTLSSVTARPKLGPSMPAPRLAERHNEA